jgi:DNA-3-methyladenine glycosylase I
VTRETLMKMTTSPQSIAMSKDLKKRGWSFVGPTTSYAFMQAMGLVDDHIDGCSRYRLSARTAASDPSLGAGRIPKRSASKG